MNKIEIVTLVLIGFIFGLVSGCTIDKRKEKELNSLIEETRQIQEEAKMYNREARRILDLYTKKLKEDFDL